MPGTDGLDQDIPRPLLSDTPNIETAVYAMLNALVPKVNLRFADSNARAAILPNPVSGTETYLVAEKRKEVFDGTSWIPMTPGQWIPLTLASGFVARTGSPAYRVVNGVLELRGTIEKSNGTPFTKGAAFTIFTLPSGVRPPAYRYFICATEFAADMHARVEVEATGGVTVIVPPSTGTGASWISLDVIRFSLT